MDPDTFRDHHLKSMQGDVKWQQQQKSEAGIHDCVRCDVSVDLNDTLDI